MKARFLDAVTHTGPGYRVAAGVPASRDGTVPTPRGSAPSARRHLLDAATHNGPGYARPTADEVEERRVARREAHERLSRATHEGVAKFRCAKDHLDSLVSITDPVEHRHQVRLAHACLEDLLTHTGDAWITAVEGARRTANPLSIGDRVQLGRVERMLVALTGKVERLLAAIERAETPQEKVATRSRAAIVERSVEAVLQAAG